MSTLGPTLLDKTTRSPPVTHAVMMPVGVRCIGTSRVGSGDLSNSDLGDDAVGEVTGPVGARARSICLDRGGSGVRGLEAGDCRTGIFYRKDVGVAAADIRNVLRVQKPTKPCFERDSLTLAKR